MDRGPNMPLDRALPRADLSLSGDRHPNRTLPTVNASNFRHLDIRGIRDENLHGIGVAIACGFGVELRHGFAIGGTGYGEALRDSPSSIAVYSACLLGGAGNDFLWSAEPFRLRTGSREVTPC